ncbi:hypothetical protein [Rubritalea tangerina]
MAIALACATCYAQDLESGGLDLQLTPTMPENVRITSSNSAEYNGETGLVRYLGGVQVYTDTGLQIFANQALVDTKKKLVLLNGDVSIYQNAVLHRGDKATYNYGTEELDTSGMRTSLDPILLDSDNFSSKTVNGKRVFIGKNAGLTTHDREKPNFWIKAKEIEVYPEEEVIFRNLKLYAGETPVFWLPYLAQPMDSQLGYHFTPGVRSNWGAFLLNRYGIMLGGDENPDSGRKENQWLLSEWQFDIRAKRGLAAGVDFTDTRLDHNPNLGWLQLYYANDSDPSISRTGLTRTPISNDRYKVEYKDRYQWQNTPGIDHIVDANFTYLSDQYYLEDFEPRKYTLNPQPDNILAYQRRSDTMQLGAFTRIQLNDFYQADQRLPELYLDHAKRPVFGSSILHEGSSSVGYYREDTGDLSEYRIRTEAELTDTTPERQSELSRILEKKNFGRLHTYQELSRPIEVTDGFTVTPRAGAGYSYYWDQGENNNTHSSPHGYLGLDAAMKFTKRFDSVKSDRWGLDELLHVIHPYANISVLATNELEDDGTKIDRLTPTERPRPFDVARYSAIDDYQNWSIVRLGTRNQLLTKRDNKSHTWLTLDSYIDAFLNDPEFNRDFSNLYNDLRWNPVPWGSLSVDTQFPINSEGFTELTTGLLFWPHENIELELGHSYLNNHPIIADSNLVHGRLFFRVNQKWSLGTYHQWQLDDNTLERQEYSFYRNFQSWTAGLGFFQRDNRIKKEYGALLNISLNALPSLNLPFSIEAQ